MHERVLREIVGQREIACQLAQKIPDLRLMPADEFAERVRILAGNDARDELMIFAASQGRGPD